MKVLRSQYNENVKHRDSRHVESGPLEGGFAEDKECGSGVGGSGVGIIPVAVSFHHGQISVHLIHCHHRHLHSQLQTDSHTHTHTQVNYPERKIEMNSTSKKNQTRDFTCWLLVANCRTVDLQTKCVFETDAMFV